MYHKPFKLFFLPLLFLLVSGSPGSRLRGVEPHTLHVSPAQGQRDLTAYAKTYGNRAEWQARADRVKQGILRGANLEPLPASSPLRPIFGQPRKHQGYSVENVAFESVPGFFVTGNLYRPLGKEGKHAGILCPHGHFEHGRFRPDHEIRCATLARFRRALSCSFGTLLVERDHFRCLTLAAGALNDGTHAVRRFAQRIVGKVTVAHGRCCLSMPQQPPNDFEAQPA